MLVQKLVVAQLGLSWEPWRSGSGAGSGGNPGMLLRVHLRNCPQAPDLVRLSASPAEEVFPGAQLCPTISDCFIGRMNFHLLEPV